MLGVFLAGLTQIGPGCLAFHSDKEFSENLKRELALKSLPIAGKEGDFVSVSIQEYQAASIILPVPAFEDTNDKRETFVAFGVILSPEVNPTSYQAALKMITDTCKENSILTVPVLKGIVPKLFQLAPTHILQITKNLEVKIDFDISLTSGQRLRDALKRL
ncbi:MAG: hypothetical protein ACXAC6_10600 [Candidatus Hodarchaeales archaeon]|jgi:hypothetical protein